MSSTFGRTVQFGKFASRVAAGSTSIHDPALLPDCCQPDRPEECRPVVTGRHRSEELNAKCRRPLGNPRHSWAIRGAPSCATFDSLSTKNKNLQKAADGSLTLYVGAKSPGADKESNWLPAPDGHFSLYIRAYWGQQGILDGSWKPPVIRKAQ